MEKEKYMSTFLISNDLTSHLFSFLSEKILKKLYFSLISWSKSWPLKMDSTKKDRRWEYLFSVQFHLFVLYLIHIDKWLHKEKVSLALLKTWERLRSRKPEFWSSALTIQEKRPSWRPSQTRLNCFNSGHLDRDTNPRFQHQKLDSWQFETEYVGHWWPESFKRLLEKLHSEHWRSDLCGWLCWHK